MLVGGNLLGQLLAFLALPILGRIYPPEVMGASAVIFSLVGIFGVVADGRYDMAIILSQGHRVRLLVAGAMLLTLAFSLLLLPVSYLISRYYLGSESYGVAASYWYFLPLMTLLTGWQSSLTAYRNERKHYGRVSLASVMQGLTGNGMKILLGLAAATAFSLVGATALGLLMIVLFLLPPPSFFSGLSFRRLRVALYRKRAFPFYNVPQALFSLLSTNMVLLLTPLFYSTREAGLLSMVYIVARSPLLLVGNSLSRMFSKEAAERFAQQRPLYQSWQRLIKIYFALSLPLGLLLYLTMPSLVKLFLGDKWLDSIPLFRMALPMLVMNLFVAIINFMPDLLSLQKLHMKIHNLLLPLELGVLFLLGDWLALDFTYYYTLYFGYRLLVYTALSLWEIRLMKRYDQSL